MNQGSKMSGKAKSILVFGIYLVITGMTLLFEPNILLKILGIHETQEIWIRIAGCLTINIGVFNILAAYSGVKIFYRWMYIARGLFIASILSFVILKQAPYIFILFAAADLLGMAWTYLAAE
jgi:hypothetical protein